MSIIPASDMRHRSASHGRREGLQIHKGRGCDLSQTARARPIPPAEIPRNDKRKSRKNCQKNASHFQSLRYSQRSFPGPRPRVFRLTVRWGSNSTSALLFFETRFALGTKTHVKAMHIRCHVLAGPGGTTSLAGPGQKPGRTCRLVQGSTWRLVAREHSACQSTLSQRDEALEPGPYWLHPSEAAGDWVAPTWETVLALSYRLFDT